MATKTLKSRIKMKRDTSANWTKNDPVLLDGEIIIVDTDAGETRYKIGDGTKKYSQLPFQDEAIRNLINGKLDKTATAADSSKLNGQEASYYAVDSDTVHKTGDENISGVKTFKGKINGTAGATIKSAGNAILNVQTVAAGTDYTHLYTSGGSNNNRPIVLNAASDGSGPVGIGVEQPTEKLEVAGNIKATGKVTVGTAPTTDLDVATKKYVDDGLSDKQTKITANGILKGDGSGGVSAATANTDYLPVSSPKMTGTPTAPTAAASTNNTQIATTAFVKTAVSAVKTLDINLNASQPSGQSTGDFWYQITTA